MSLIAAALALALQTTPPEAAWTWTLYAGDAPLVLANEVPDTASLRATLECDPGSSVARVTLYGGAGGAGMARVSAGEASAVAEAGAGHDGGYKLAIRTDHPVFAAFVVDGKLSVTLGDDHRTVEVQRAFLPRLRRFAELCAG